MFKALKGESLLLLIVHQSIFSQLKSDGNGLQKLLAKNFNNYYKVSMTLGIPD